jgi:hypothetical protein
MYANILQVIQNYQKMLPPWTELYARKTQVIGYVL